MGDHTFCFDGIENVTKLLNVGCTLNTFSRKHRVATYKFVVISHRLACSIFYLATLYQHRPQSTPILTDGRDDEKKTIFGTELIVWEN